MRKKCSWYITVFMLILILLTGCEKQDGRTLEKDKGCQLTFLDTGKSDCIIVQMDDLVIMNDTADEDDYYRIMDFLEEKEIEKIDYMILSHFDKDHIGSAAGLIKNVEIGCVLMPNYWGDSTLYSKMMTALQQTDTEYSMLNEDYEIMTSNGSVTVSVPCKSFYEDENNYSLITTVEYGDNAFLLTGDAMKQRMEEFVNAVSLSEGMYDVVKTPHHGDYNKKLKTLIEQTKPSYCVITADSTNSTVEDKLLQLLEENQVQILYTHDGDITVKSDGKNVTVGP